jgi:hypothetical protein
MYPYYGTVVYGTGYSYPPYIGRGVYYPRPMTYGFNVFYNPWVGFGFGYGYGTPFYYSGMHFGPYYGPGWWGPPGYRPYPPPYPGGWYRPPPGHRPPYPGYGHRPPAQVAGGWSTNIYARPENRTRNADKAPATANPPAPRPTNRPNNVYADRKGNVYRQNEGGSWDRNTAQGWKQQEAGLATRPSAPPKQAARPTASRPSHTSAPAGLGRDAAARQRSAPPPSRPASAPARTGSASGSHGGGGGGGKGGGR